jgi:hypothetical protein
MIVALAPFLLCTLTVSVNLLHAAEQLDICYDFGCKHKKSVELSTPAIKKLSHLFDPQPNNASDERRRIQQAIALLEEIVGEIAGTSQDIGGNYDPNREYPRQMDCIDESTNTTRYLKLLDQLNLLKWHRPKMRVYRSRFFIDGHWTAVIEERHNQKPFAVDSWYGDNGQPPEIQPLSDWLKRKRPKGRSTL